MSGLQVELLSHTPDLERLVACAAKLCYSASGIGELMEGLTDEKAEGFLKMLTEVGHESPVEHAVFTFGISGVSRSLLAQITRHRLASFSVKSQRYVKEGQFEYVVPPEIDREPRAREIFIKAMREDQETYNRLADILEERHFSALTAEGMPEGEARRAAGKRAIEDARFVLPNACTTQMLLTMNARSLMNFFRLRCCSRAQWEIRELANRMLALVKKEAPTLFRLAGPGCLSGPCPEGSMSCKKAPEMRGFYKNL